MKFEFNTEKKKWECLDFDDNNNVNNDETITPNAFLSGDLALIRMVLGKEWYEGCWCYFCEFSRMIGCLPIMNRQ
jgi:hypothetical protein